MNDFSKKTLKALAARGVRIIRLQAIPNMASDLPYANAERGYVVDDNGTGRVWTFTQVMERAQ